PASDAHLESKASALACRSKAEALDSSRPVPRLAGTMIKAATTLSTQISDVRFHAKYTLDNERVLVTSLRGQPFAGPRTSDARLRDSIVGSQVLAPDPGANLQRDL
uniref:hypothetical protein n=4 Tax=uncultured Lamprocystis sp. TaxID=543132 RepID=UPI0025D918C3